LLVNTLLRGPASGQLRAGRAVCCRQGSRATREQSLVRALSSILVGHRRGEQALAKALVTKEGGRPGREESLARRLCTAMSESPVEAAKRLAARTAVDSHVSAATRVVGVGSGSTVVYAVQRLKERARQEGLNFVCVPTSFQARQLVTSSGLVLSDLESSPCVDVTIDGCDEADSSLSLIKGGGGCMTQEKVVAAYSNQLVVVADFRKASLSLGTSWAYIPLEVLPSAYRPLMQRLERELGGRASLRMAGHSKAGPVVTDNGGLVVDWYFDKERLGDMAWAEVEQRLRAMVGVVETGLFVGMADKAYFGMEDGSVQERVK